MSDVPKASPVNIPDEDPTEATAVLLETHVPPGRALLKVPDVPTHTNGFPVIVGTDAITVTVLVEAHPAGRLYVTMTVPGMMPDIIPVDMSIVATEGAPDCHVPPGKDAPIAPGVPIHSAAGPVIVAAGSTLRKNALPQPVGSV